MNNIIDEYRAGYLQALKDVDETAKKYDARAYECCGNTAHNIRLRIYALMRWIKGEKP